MTSRAPFRLEASEDGSWALLLYSSDIDDGVAEVFRALRRHEYGYGWEGLAQHVLESELSDVPDAIDFDCENDTFCAISDRRDALHRLRERLAELYSNPKELRRVLKSAPRDQWSEMFLPEG